MVEVMKIEEQILIVSVVKILFKNQIHTYYFFKLFIMITIRTNFGLNPEQEWTQV